MRNLSLAAASLAVLLAGPATAAVDVRRAKAVPHKEAAAAVREQPARPQRSTFTVRPDHRKRDDARKSDRREDRREDRRHDWDRDDRRRDDDWRRSGWQYQGRHHDGWRYYRGHDHRHWRHLPPHRYSVDHGYRSGYELAWRDWLHHGRHDRRWRRSAFHGYGPGHSYRSGYEAGWRDAAYYYGRGYRPDYWSYDPLGGWFFGFRIGG